MNTLAPQTIAAVELHEQWVNSVGRLGAKLELPDNDLQGVNWAGRKLNEAILPGCNFTAANLSHVDFYGANVASGIFVEANLAQTQFIKSEISYAKFTRATLKAASFVRAAGWETVFERADLEEADLRYANFFKCNFAGANLRGCLLNGLTLEEANLVDADLRGAHDADKAYLVSATVRLNGAVQQLEGETLRAWLLAATA